MSYSLFPNIYEKLSFVILSTSLQKIQEFRLAKRANLLSTYCIGIDYIHAIHDHVQGNSLPIPLPNFLHPNTYTFAGWL
jgi:hypothetical protein